MAPVGGANLWHAPKNQVVGTNRLDEIPVDLVAKILFQHVLLETRGIIHTSSLNYISKTMNQIMAEARHGADHCSTGWGAIMARNVFTTDRSNQECRIARSYKGMLAGDWQFDNTKSRGLGHDGPLSLDISNHDMSAFTQKKVIEIFNMRGRSGASNRSRWLRRSLCGYQLSGEICKPRNCLPLSFPQRTWHACRAASKVGSGTRAITSSTWGPCWASISWTTCWSSPLPWSAGLVMVKLRRRKPIMPWLGRAADLATPTHWRTIPLWGKRRSGANGVAVFPTIG